ncbi:MAG: hypothetical protein LBP59_19605 [Planctomycetaceae bacterium]|nr:hypothetical protein [Planctomycetaceae bacterium]
MLQKSLHRRYKWQSELPDRTVLEHLVYAALLENAPAEIATTAYEILESYFIDWNEVRVATTQELAEIITILPDPTAAAERVRKALRGVFEKTYMFDLEELRKKGKSLSQAIAFLKSLGTLSQFMADYVTQFALGGHVIPLDESALRIFRMLDLAQVNKERTEEYVPGIERAVPKKNGIVFTMELHNYAFLLRTALDSNQTPNEYLSVLKNIDSQAPTRDYTPPALAVPKPQPKEKIIPPPVNIPFGVAADDDDFDEEHIGTEVEFLPSNLHEDNELNGYYENKSKSKKETTNEKISQPQNKKIKTNAATPPKQINTKIEPKKNTEIITPKKETNIKNIAKKTNAENIKITQITPKNNTINKNANTKPTTKIIETKKQNTKNITPVKKQIPEQKKITKKIPTPPTKKITNNNKNEKQIKTKIINIVAKESKSITKQLQKKKPK